MDIMTLAAARAYTDKKVAEGGGSGGGLPMVVLSTTPTEEGALLTEEECAAIQAAFDTGLPCIIKYSYIDYDDRDRQVSCECADVFLVCRRTDRTGLSLCYGMIKVLDRGFGYFSLDSGSFNSHKWSFFKEIRSNYYTEEV